MHLLTVLHAQRYRPLEDVEATPHIAGIMTYGPALYHEAGRPVGYSLLQREQPNSTKQRRGPKDPKEGWQSAAVWDRRVPVGEEDDAQLERALRSGRGRRRRFFHDRLLRDIAGRVRRPLTSS